MRLDGRALGPSDAGVDQLVLREDQLTPTDLAFTLTDRPCSSRRREGVEARRSSTAGLSTTSDEPGDSVPRPRICSPILAALLRQPERRTRPVIAPPDDWEPSALSTRSSPVSRIRPCSPRSRSTTTSDRAARSTTPDTRSRARRAVDGVARPVRRRAVRTRQRLTGSRWRSTRATRCSRRPSDGCSSRAPALTTDRRSAYLGAVDAEINQRTRSCAPGTAIGHADVGDARSHDCSTADPARVRVP